MLGSFQFNGINPGYIVCLTLRIILIRSCFLWWLNKIRNLVCCSFLSSYIYTDYSLQHTCFEYIAMVLHWYFSTSNDIHISYDTMMQGCSSKRTGHCHDRSWWLIKILFILAPDAPYVLSSSCHLLALCQLHYHSFILAQPWSYIYNKVSQHIHRFFVV